MCNSPAPPKQTDVRLLGSMVTILDELILYPPDNKTVGFIDLSHAHESASALGATNEQL